MSHTFFMSSLRDLFYLIEARDEFFIQTFGQKLVAKVKTDIGNNMQLPADLTRQLQAEGELPPENRIVQWFISKDPMEGKASQWLITQYLRGFFQLEDIDHVVGLVNEFVAKRARNELEIKDLGQYKTVAQLETAVGANKPAEEAPTEPDEQIDPAMLQQMDVYKNNANVFIAHLKTQAAAVFAGSTKLYGSLNKNKQTRWCTAYTPEQNRSNYFNTYNPQGPIIVVIVKRGPDAGKYQFHFESNQFKDAEDIEIRNLRAWLHRNEDVRATLAQKATEHGKMDFMSKEDFLRARQTYIDQGTIKLLLNGTQHEVLWLPQAHYRLQTMITGEAMDYQNKAHRLPTKGSGPYSEGVFIFIDKKTLKYATYKLGYNSILIRDKKGYPFRNFIAKDEELVALFKQLKTAQDTGDTPKATADEEHEQLVNKLVEAGDAKQIYKTKNITTWWFKDIKVYGRYFKLASDHRARSRAFSTAEMFPDAGILLFDNGESLYAYRCGDKNMHVADTHKYETEESYFESISVADFIDQNRDSRDILQRYADRFHFFPLMSTKGKTALYQELTDKKAIEIISADTPRIVKLNTPEAAPIIIDVISDSTESKSLENIKKAIGSELKHGEVFVINDEIVFMPKSHSAWAISSGSLKENIHGLFNRFPTIVEKLKPTLMKYGIPEAKLELKDVVPEMVRTGSISPVSASPLVFQLNKPAGVTWFVRQHLHKKADNNTSNAPDGSWKASGLVDPATELMTKAAGGKTFGILIRGTTPFLLFIRKTDTGEHELSSAVYDKDSMGVRNNKTTNHAGTVAYLQKFPDVVKALAPHLGDIEDSWADVFRTLAGVSKTDAQGNQVRASDGYSKALHAVSNMLASAKTQVNARAGEEQTVSDTNAEKFRANAKKTAAALEQAGPTMTDDEAKKIAKHIREVLSFVSNRSYRPVPKELAEWLKHATNVSPQTKLELILQNPVFIAGLDSAPKALVTAIYDSRDTKGIDAARLFANMSKETEKALDDDLMNRGTYYGVQWENYREKNPAKAAMPHNHRSTILSLQNVPLAEMQAIHRGMGNTKRLLRQVDFPTEEFLMWVLRNHPHAITNTSLVSEKKTPKFMAALKFYRKNNTLNGFVYTPPAERPVAAQRPVRQPRAAAPAGAGAAGGEARQGPAAGFATKAEHARHIIANRTPEDNRQSLIRKLIDDAGLTAAGAATYYYNLTRAAVAEGEEDLSFFRASLRCLFG